MNYRKLAKDAHKHADELRTRYAIPRLGERLLTVGRAAQTDKRANTIALAVANLIVRVLRQHVGCNLRTVTCAVLDQCALAFRRGSLVVARFQAKVTGRLHPSKIAVHHSPDK